MMNGQSKADAIRRDVNREIFLNKYSSVYLIRFKRKIFFPFVYRNSLNCDNAMSDTTTDEKYKVSIACAFKHPGFPMMTSR